MNQFSGRSECSVVLPILEMIGLRLHLDSWWLAMQFRLFWIEKCRQAGA